MGREAQTMHARLHNLPRMLTLGWQGFVCAHPPSHASTSPCTSYITTPPSNIFITSLPPSAVPSTPSKPAATALAGKMDLWSVV